MKKLILCAALLGLAFSSAAQALEASLGRSPGTERLALSLVVSLVAMKRTRLTRKSRPPKRLPRRNKRRRN
jgi:hypothetical protein